MATVTKKIETDACTICNGKNCEGCCFNPELENNCALSDQILKLIHDGYFSLEKISEIFILTQAKIRGDQV